MGNSGGPEPAGAATPDSDVLVVGGGFAGLYAAKTAAHRGLSVTLVDAQGHQTFQPLLYQVASGLLPVDVVDYPLHEVPGVRAVQGRVSAADLEGRSVTLEDGSTLRGDSLILATGASVNFYDVPGAREHALPLYRDTDALAIKARLLDLIAAKAAFDVVVVGAGATGIEITGALGDVVRTVLPRTYPDFSGESVTIHVVDHASAPLAHMSTASQAYAQRVLEQAGVVFHLGSNVARVDEGSVTLDGGASMRADMVIWAAGVRARPPVMSPDPAAGSDGRVAIDSTLRIPGHPRVFCIGDCAADPAHPLPQLGSVAKQQGIHVGHSLGRMRHGHEPKPFSYRDLGTMAMLRHDRAVVEAGRHHHQIDGVAAYAMWLGLHAALLPDDHDRVEAVHAWIDEATTKRSRFLGA